jgi:hypothetical protein
MQYLLPLAGIASLILFALSEIFLIRSGAPAGTTIFLSIVFPIVAIPLYLFLEKILKV